MPEIRIDPLTGHRAIIAAEPGARGESDGAQMAHDPFAAGHESETPPELYAVRPGGGAADTPGWQVRVIPHRDPALTGDAEPPPRSAEPDLFWAGAARGAHELIVNAPEPVAALADLSTEQVSLAVEVWRERMRAHPGAACLHLTVDEGRQAGAEVAHSHAQLYALDFVPAAIARERERFGAYATRTMGGNLLADLVQHEVRRRERIVAIDGEAVAIAAYGPRVPYQMLIAPRTPRLRFEDDGPTGAAILHDVLGRLARLLGASPPLNLWVRTAPRGAEHFCWRIEILPRLAPPAGLELGTGVPERVLAPELAAAALRDA